MRAVALALTLLASTASAQTVTPPAPPPEPARQGRGTIVLTDANRASAGFHVYDRRVGVHGYSFVLAPTLDVFVNRVLTVGGALQLGYENSEPLYTFSIGGDARVGLYGVLGARWAIWPTLALGVSHDSSSAIHLDGSSSSAVSLRARLDAPFLFYPAPGFFVGAGPLVGLTGVNRTSQFDRYASFGLITTLGGTF